MFFPLLTTHHTWAADWTFYTTSSKGGVYYDKSRIKKVNKNIRYVHTKTLYNENEKKETFSMLKRTAKAPKNPDMLNHALVLFEVDCINEIIKDFFTAIYDKKGKVIYWSTKGNAGQWKNIHSNAVDEKLKNIVCQEPSALNKTVIAFNTEKPPVHKEATVVASTVTDKNSDQVNSRQNEAKQINETAVRRLVTKWLANWQAGDMETYRSCYASDFKAKGMSLDAWIAYKTKVSRKSKNIDIRINDLEVSAENNNATAVFTQYYSSSILKDTCKKKLELRLINNEWKIYREVSM